MVELWHLTIAAQIDRMIANTSASACTDEFYEERIYITCDNVNAATIGPAIDTIIDVIYLNMLLVAICIDDLHVSLIQSFLLTEIGSPYRVILQLNHVHFSDDDEMINNWYRGKHHLAELRMLIPQLKAIHTHAFNGTAFEILALIEMKIQNGAVHLHRNAFKDAEYLTHFRLVSHGVTMTAGLFDRQAVMMTMIAIDPWPNNINLNQMFAGDVYRNLAKLDVRNVEAPQTLFRLLAAANFTQFRRLKYLSLLECGIELIAPHAFDTIAHELVLLDLQRNPIKHINIDMFRRMFESKIPATLDVGIKYTLICTCEIVETMVLVCPILPIKYKDCIKCKKNAHLNVERCPVRRNIVLSKFRIGRSIKMMMSIIRIRMAVSENAISFETEFSSKVRVILVNWRADRSRRCIDRTSKTSYKCVYFRKRIDRLDLIAIDEMRHAEFILVTAIPILWRFGARPMHSMTVRCTTTIDISMCALIMFYACVAGFVFGFVGKLCSVLVQRTIATTEDKDESPYEYDSFEQIEMNVIEVIDYDDYGYFEQRSNAVLNDYI